MEQLALGEFERLKGFTCIWAPPQKPGHVGVTSPNFAWVKTMDEARGWLDEHADNPYVRVQAVLYDETEQRETYKDVFLKDDSVVVVGI